MCIDDGQPIQDEHDTPHAQRNVCISTIVLFILADRTDTQYMIGYWHHPVVCLSVRLSVTLCIVALSVGVQG